MDFFTIKIMVSKSSTSLNLSIEFAFLALLRSALISMLSCKISFKFLVAASYQILVTGSYLKHSSIKILKTNHHVTLTLTIYIIVLSCGLWKV